MTLKNDFFFELVVLCLHNKKMLFENIQNQNHHERALSPSSKSKTFHHGFSTTTPNSIDSTPMEFKAHLQLKVDELLLKFLNSKESQFLLNTNNNNNNLQLQQSQREIQQPSSETISIQIPIPTSKSGLLL